MERKIAHRRGKRGFTIIELMIVISLIGVLSTIAIPYYQKVTARARRAEMETTISKMRMSLINTYHTQSFFPPPADPGGVSTWNPCDPVTGTPPMGQAAQWNTADPDWFNLPSMDGAVRMRYQYSVSNAGQNLTLSAQGYFFGIGNYSYSESWQGSDPLGQPVEFPAF